MLVFLYKKYKYVWHFLAKFFAVYILGVVSYNTYLGRFGNSVDGMTRWVTEQVASLFSKTLPEITTVYAEANPMAEIRYFDVTLIYVIEGCNAISVMILFVAFIVAFTGPLKHYLWFVPSGLGFIYLANIFRIYLIGMIVLYYNSWTEFSHDYLFPGIIYGSVFLLWVIWVKYFANKPGQKKESEVTE